MDAETLAQFVINFLVPFLPYLIKGGATAVRTASEILGDVAWEKAKSLWKMLQSEADKNPAIQRAWERAEKNPKDVRVIGLLEIQLEELLEADDAFAKAISEEVESLSHTISIVNALKDASGGEIIIIAHSDGNRIFIPTCSQDEKPIPPNNKYSNLKTSHSDKNFKVSISCPQLLSTRFESVFLCQIYLPEDRIQVTRNIKSEFQEQKTREDIKQSMIHIGQKVKVTFFSSEFDFSDAVVKLINSTVNKVTFLGKPKDNCEPGLHKVLISISDAESQQEFESFTIAVRVVDFAFDHISRPLLSRASAVALGIGSFAMFILTSLEQIDKTVGLTSGTAAGVLALGIYASFYNLYQRVRPNTP